MRRVLILAIAAASCVRNELVECGAFLCPIGKTCDLVHATCVTPEQASVCTSAGDGDPCDAAGTPGICDQGYCSSGCGDGVLDPARDEECDDGNFASHDGCSSGCLVEAPSWVEVPSPWAPRFGHGAAFHAFANKLVVFGGFVPDGTSGEQWERPAKDIWRDVTSTLATKPSQRTGTAMAYDPVRKVIVLFGGRDQLATPLNDLWEYDGTTWTRRTIGTPWPSARWASAMSYDYATNTILLFGGSTAAAQTNETWRWDGTAWTPDTVVTAPSARHLPALASDPVRKVIVLFGGLSGNTPQQDTWEWSGAAWTLINPTTKPATRYGAAMAYYPDRDRVVMFGGERSQGSSTFADSWEYDGTNWAPYAGLPTLPPGRYEATLSYDPPTGTLTLVGGGRASTRTPQADAWDYNTTPTWGEITPRFPGARQTTLAYDELRHQLVMFAGANAIADTWTFADHRWINVTGGSAPAPRRFHAMAYDSRRDRVVVFGGLDSSAVPLDSMLEGTPGATYQWTSIVTSPRPSARESATMVFDAKRGVSVLFGGQAGATQMTDTWEYDGAAWKDRSATTRPPPARIPAMAYDPVGGRTILVAEDGTTWAYADGTWMQLGGIPAPARIAANLAFDRTRGRVVLHGGRTDVPTTDTYELADDGWHVVEVVGDPPPPRFLPALAGLDHEHAVVLFGGGASGGTIGDTWIYQHRSETPDEDCADGADNDGDRQVDAADPDCGGP